MTPYIAIGIFVGALAIYCWNRPSIRSLGPSLLDSFIFGVDLFALGSILLWGFTSVPNALDIMMISLISGTAAMLAGAAASRLLRDRLALIDYVQIIRDLRGTWAERFAITVGLGLCIVVTALFAAQVFSHGHLRALLLDAILHGKPTLNQARLIISGGTEGYFAPGYIKQFRDIGVPIFCAAALLCHGAYRNKLIFYSAIIIALAAMFVSGQRLVVISLMLCLLVAFVLDFALAPARPRLMPVIVAIPLFTAMAALVIVMTVLLGRVGGNLFPVVSEPVAYEFNLRWTGISGTSLTTGNQSLSLKTTTAPGDENKYRLRSQTIRVEPEKTYTLHYAADADDTAMIGVVDEKAEKFLAKAPLTGANEVSFVASSDRIYLVIASFNSAVGESSVTLKDISLGQSAQAAQTKYHAFGMNWNRDRLSVSIIADEDSLTAEEDANPVTQTGTLLITDPIEVDPSRQYTVNYSLREDMGHVLIGVRDDHDLRWLSSAPATEDELSFKPRSGKVRIFLANAMDGPGRIAVRLQSLKMRFGGPAMASRSPTVEASARVIERGAPKEAARATTAWMETELRKLAAERAMAAETRKESERLPQRALNALAQLAHRAFMAAPQENAISYYFWAARSPALGRGWFTELASMRPGTQSQLSNDLSAANRGGELGNSPLGLPADLYFEWGLAGVALFSAFYAIFFLMLDIALTTSDSALLLACKLFLFISIPFMYSPFLFILYGGAAVIALMIYVGTLRRTAIRSLGWLA